MKESHSRHKGGALSFLTASELRQLLDATNDRNARDYCMVLIAYRHGLRASEVCGLRAEAVDLPGGRIVCHRLKGSVTNWQRLGTDEVMAVKAWLDVRPKADVANLFVDDDGHTLSRYQFYRMFRRQAQAARPDRPDPGGRALPARSDSDRRQPVQQPRESHSTDQPGR